MKTILVLFLCFSAGCAGIPTAARNMVGSPAPSTRLTMMSGDYYGMDDFKGKDTYVLFWASWCSQSKAALEAFNELAKNSTTDQDAVFIAASIDPADRAEEVQGLIQQKGYTAVRHAFSGNDSSDEAFIAFNAETIPHIVALNREGIVTLVDGDVDSIEKLRKEPR